MNPILSRQLLALAPLVCALCHIVEEFVLPGGFLTWYKRFRPGYAASITPAHLFRINSASQSLVAAITPS